MQTVSFKSLQEPRSRPFPQTEHFKAFRIRTDCPAYNKWSSLGAKSLIGRQSSDFLPESYLLLLKQSSHLP